LRTKAFISSDQFERAGLEIDPCGFSKTKKATTLGNLSFYIERDFKAKDSQKGEDKREMRFANFGNIQSPKNNPKEKGRCQPYEKDKEMRKVSRRY
jgi:hypothetical protein